MALIRIPGVPGWVDEADIKPCGSCGGSAFWIGRGLMGGALCCVKCLPPKNGEALGLVDMVRREVRLFRRR